MRKGVKYNSYIFIVNKCAIKIIEIYLFIN